MEIQAAKKKLLELFEAEKNGPAKFEASGLIALPDLVAQIIFELIKKQYYGDLPKKSLRKYVDTNSVASDAVYEQLKRNRNKAETAKSDFCRQFGVSPQPRDGFQSKASGYRYNALQIQQINNYQNLQMVTALDEGRMADSKKISRRRFRSIYEEYDGYVITQLLKMNGPAEETLSAAIDFYDLQIRMNVELTYRIALAMERFHFRDYPSLEASPYILGFFGNQIRLQNRFLLKKNDWLSYVFNERHATDRQDVDGLYALLMGKYEIMKSIPAWEFELEDMANFIRTEYNPFSVFEREKEWTDIRVDLARKVLRSFWIGKD